MNKQFQQVPYTVKHIFLPANIIYNINGPEFKEGCPTYAWDDASIRQRQQFAEKYINKYNKITNQFYDRLAHSLFNKGCQDPVVLCAGQMSGKYLKHLPQYYQDNRSEILASIGPGCSRLYWMQKWDWQCVPCVVLDWVNRFPDAEVIETEEQLKNKWHNKPKGFLLGSVQLSIKGNVFFD